MIFYSVTKHKLFDLNAPVAVIAQIDRVHAIRNGDICHVVRPISILAHRNHNPPDDFALRDKHTSSVTVASCPSAATLGFSPGRSASQRSSRRTGPR